LLRSSAKVKTRWPLFESFTRSSLKEKIFCAFLSLACKNLYSLEVPKS